MAAVRAALAPSLTPGNTTETCTTYQGEDTNNTYGITVRCSNWDGTLCRQPEILRSGTAEYYVLHSDGCNREILQAQWCYLATGDTSVSAGSSSGNQGAAAYDSRKRAQCVGEGSDVVDPTLYRMSVIGIEWSVDFFEWQCTATTTTPGMITGQQIVPGPGGIGTVTEYVSEPTEVGLECNRFFDHVRCGGWVGSELNSNTTNS